MKCFVYTTLLAVALSSALCSAEKNDGFRERAEIYSRLIDCDYYKTDDYNYSTNSIHLKNVKDAQPDGYYARVPVYFIGSRDAHVVLSPIDFSTVSSSALFFAYEFVFGGYGNTRLMIRKRVQNYLIKEVTLASVVSELRPLKALIEVSKDGHIRVHFDNKAEPVIEAYDPFVLPVEYMSFASYQGASVEFLYNCASDTTALDLSKDLHKQPEVTTNDLSLVPIEELEKKCETEETWELAYKKFHALKDLKHSQAEGYIFKLNFFIFGHKEVHVLLSPTDKPNIENGYTKDQSAYEVIVGGYGGARHVIRKTVEDDDLFEKVQIKDLVPEEKQTRVLIQLRNDGLLEVFVGELQYKAIVKAFAKPIDVKYVSFASSDGNRVLYFYNCDDEKAAKTILPVPVSNAHPFFADSAEYNEEALTKTCKHTHAWEDVYSTPVKLDSIKNSQPDGYVVRIPVFVKGVRDAHILLQSGNSANPNDGYEIVLGGWGDTKHLIRKDGDVVTKVNEYNVLNEFQPIKVVVELNKDGELKVFTDANKYTPLLYYKDPQPINNLSTISFTAYFRNVDFYYGCSS